MLQAEGRVAEAVVSRLLTAAVADTAVSVRRQVLRAFERTTALDAYLAQADRCTTNPKPNPEHNPYPDFNCNAGPNFTLNCYPYPEPRTLYPLPLSSYLHSSPNTRYLQCGAACGRCLWR